MTPEQLARQQIDAELTACGWTIQDYNRVDLSAARGIALREGRMSGGFADYFLVVDRSPVERARVGLVAGSPRLVELSAEHLLRFLTTLGQDVVIVVRGKTRRCDRLTVVAA